jgi:hypothetical protein
MAIPCQSHSHTLLFLLSYNFPRSLSTINTCYPLSVVFISIELNCLLDEQYRLQSVDATPSCFEFSLLCQREVIYDGRENVVSAQHPERVKVLND